jgi:hypothetical protein
MCYPFSAYCYEADICTLDNLESSEEPNSRPQLVSAVRWGTPYSYLIWTASTEYAVCTPYIMRIQPWVLYGGHVESYLSTCTEYCGRISGVMTFHIDARTRGTSCSWKLVIVCHWRSGALWSGIVILFLASSACQRRYHLPLPLKPLLANVPGLFHETTIISSRRGRACSTTPNMRRRGL